MIRRKHHGHLQRLVPNQGYAKHQPCQPPFHHHTFSTLSTVSTIKPPICTPKSHASPSLSSPVLISRPHIVFHRKALRLQLQKLNFSTTTTTTTHDNTNDNTNDNQTSPLLLNDDNLTLSTMIQQNDIVGIIEYMIHLLHTHTITKPQLDHWLSTHYCTISPTLCQSVRLLIEYVNNEQGLSSEQVIRLIESVLEYDVDDELDEIDTIDNNLEKKDQKKKMERRVMRKLDHFHHLLSGEIDYLIAKQTIQKMQRGGDAPVTDREWNDCTERLNWAIRKRPHLYQAYYQRAMIGISGKIHNSSPPLSNVQEEEKSSGDEGSETVMQQMEEMVRRDIEQCLSINPQFAPAHLALGLYYANFTTHGFREAIQSFTTCIELVEQSVARGDHRWKSLIPAALFHRASIHLIDEFAGRNVHSALSDYDRAIALDPQNPLLYQMRGTLLASEFPDQKERARADFRMASEITNSRTHHE